MAVINQNLRIRQFVKQGAQDYPDALFREVSFFRPSGALSRMNCLLSTAPVDLKELGVAAKEAASLASEAIKLCNSSAVCLSRPVSRLEQAVIATDADFVRTLLLTCWLTRLSGSSVESRANQSFWSHGLLVAQICRRTSEWTGLVPPEHAFMAGLLHDAGALPILTMLSREGDSRGQDIREAAGDSPEYQRLRFKTDHCDLGRRLNSVLNFPLPVAEVMARHHQPHSAGSGSPLLSIAGFAEEICTALHLTAKNKPAGDCTGTIIKDALRTWLPGLSPSAATQIVEDVNSVFRCHPNR